MNRSERLGSETMGKLLLSLCGQCTASLILYSIYSLTDTMFIARGVGDDAAGAVALAAPLLFLLSAVSSTAGCGGASIISRALGRKDTELAGVTAANVFTVFWVFAIFITITGLVFLEPLLRLIGATGSILPHARAYARIILAGAVTSTGFSAFMRAEGDTRFSLYTWVVPVFVNIVLDALFILILHLGTHGAALATVCAQVVSCGMSFWFFFIKKHRPYRIHKKHFRIRPSLLLEIGSVGLPAFLQQMSSSVVLIVLNRILGFYGGETAIIAFGYASRLQNLILLPQSGIVQGVQPVIGYNYTAKKDDRVRHAMRLCFLASCIYGLIAGMIGILLRFKLLGIFTSQKAVWAIGHVALTMGIITAFIKGISPLIAAYYQSIGEARAALTISIAGFLILQLPLLVTLGSKFGMNGIYIALPLVDILMVLLTLAIVLWLKRKGRNLL